MNLLDKNDIELKKGDIFNIHQTVNGQNLFVILNVEKLDVRYVYDICRKYEYDVESLLEPCSFTGESEFEIIGNIYDIMYQLKRKKR